MKAVRLNQWGHPVQIEDVPQPTPGDDEVLVRVRAASVNPVDRAIAAGYMQAYASAPLTLGTDFAGEVAATGGNVQHVQPGQAVYGMSLSRGTFAEYAVVPAAGVARKPRTLDNVQAAAVPLAGLTAWQTLFNLAKLESGERVLIHGAGGGIGLLAVQLAKNVGAYVIAHDRGDKASFLQQLGADMFIDSETERFEDVAGDLDVVLDLVGGEYVQRSLAACGPGARYVTPAAMVSGEEGQSRGIFVSGTFTQPTPEELTKLADEIDAGQLKVFVSRTFPMEKTQAAMNYKSEDAPGKVVVTVG
jgi:NADPH:quinone reductase-like Zn-dependent oxidoreductase